MKYLFTLLIFITADLANAQTGWLQISSFGSNPGALNMYSYAPAGLPNNAPLVVAMHGCTQNATEIATQTGWNTLADRHNFYVVYPEQTTANNSNKCFNWFLSGDQSKNQGEAMSVKQMVNYMMTHYNIDSSRIFVTGLSAGACMSNVMLACYPQTFNKGAIMAGVPYKAATSAATAGNAGNGFVIQTPVQWGNLVRNENPGYNGPFPKVAVFHGSSDPVVNINNATEQVKQWTNVHSADQTSDLTQNSFAGNAYVTKNVYQNTNNQPVVETYIVSSFGHAVALDTGGCFQQCGITGTYAYDINFNSTFWAAYFFGIIQNPYVITGPSNVSIAQSGVNYSVPVNNGSSYSWIVPSGASISTGQGTNSITVNFGSSSGEIFVTETDVNGCKIGPNSLYVNVSPTGITYATNSEVNVYYNNVLQHIIIDGSDQKNISSVKIFQIDGKLVYQSTGNPQQISFGNNIPKGLYLLEILIDSKAYRKKILID